MKIDKGMIIAGVALVGLFLLTRNRAGANGSLFSIYAGHLNEATTHAKLDRARNVIESALVDNTISYTEYTALMDIYLKRYNDPGVIW